MKIYKFGGTSIGSANRMKDAAKLITNTERKIVVVSAISGTTNTLLKIAEHLYSKKNYDAELLINELENKYRLIADGLFDNSKFLCEGKELIDLNINNIKSLAQNAFTIHEEKAILAHGELITSALFQLYLQEQKVDSVLLPALNFMRIDANRSEERRVGKECRSRWSP